MADLSSYLKTRSLFSHLRKQRENNRFLNMVEIAVSFLFIYILLLVAIKPAVNAISDLLGQIEAREKLTQQMRQKINSIVVAQETYSQIQQDYDLIQASLPDTPSYYQATSQFVVNGTNNALPMTDVDFIFSKDKDKKDAKTQNSSYSISSSSTSNFRSIISFLSSILNNRRIYRFTGLSLSAPAENEEVGEGSSSTDVVFDYSADIYYWDKLNK